MNFPRRTRPYRPATLLATVVVAGITCAAAAGPAAADTGGSTPGIPPGAPAGSPAPTASGVAASSPAGPPTTAVATDSATDPATLGAIPSADLPIVQRIAALTDQLQKVEEQVVAAQVRKSVDEVQLAQAVRVLRQDAVAAFVDGGRTTPAQSLFEPSPVPAYYERVVVRHQGDVIASLHQAQQQAQSDEAAYEADYTKLSSISSQLDQQRAQLEAAAARFAALGTVTSSTLSRAVAIAQQQQAQQQSVQTAAASGAPLPPVGGIAVATQQQQTTTGTYSLGPFNPANLAADGLHATGQVVSGVASWYGPGFDGRPTASGAIYDENGWTCASPDLPFGTLLLVSGNGASVLIVVNDRGPYADGRVLDLSHAAALALNSTGLVDVVAQVVAP